MSKLSFRARALDASKPMPIYLAEELPDLPDYSAINRAVPQMPSGMEKEEECEHHLQRAICTGLIIPTPEVCAVHDIEFYERCYPPDYKMPKQHIHMQPLWQEQEAPEYDIDSDDERWLKQQRHPELTELKFEQMMDKLERSSGQTVVTLSEAKLLLERHDDLVIAVYDYWLNKRLKTQHPLILSVKTESRPGQSTNNPYLAFRRRTEKMQTRKNRKNDESSYEKMLKLRRDLGRALTLLSLVAKRERAKRDLVKLTALLSERRYQAGDFATHKPQQPVNSRPVYAVSLAAQTANFRRDAFAPHFPAHAQPPRAPSTLDNRQREKRPYKRRKHRHHAAGSHALRDSGVYTSSEEESPSRAEAGTPPDDGPYAFRRKAGCFYEMPTSTLYGDPLDPNNASKEALYQHDVDDRFRFTLTSINQPYQHCIGFARRRIGRGGRVLLDRVATPLDDLWPRLPFNHTQSSSYKAERAEEVEFETEQHRNPKVLTRDYHTSNRYPWRQAFRRHLSRHPHLWVSEPTTPEPELKLDPHGIIKSEPIDNSEAMDIESDKLTSDISVSVDKRTVDEQVQFNVQRVSRKRSLSGSSDSSYDSDESLQPVEQEFERFMDEVSKKWLHFRPKTPPPAPPSPPPTNLLPLTRDTPIAVELRTSPSDGLDTFTTSEFTLSEIYPDMAPDAETSLEDDLLNENLGLTEAQVESILSDADLKALADVDDKKMSITEDLLEELVKTVDVKDPFLYTGQGPTGGGCSGPKMRRRRERASFGSTLVSVHADVEPMFVERLEEKPVKVASPKPVKVETIKEEPKEVKAPEVKEVKAVAAAPVPKSRIIVEEVNEVPQIKIEPKKPAPVQPPRPKDDTLEEVQLTHGVQLKTVQSKHSPLKKHIITSGAQRRPPAPQIVTVAVSDSLKVRLQNHLLSTSGGAHGAQVVGLVQNGPFTATAVSATPQVVPASRELATVVSVAGTSSPRRVAAPVVHLAPASVHQKQMFSPQAPVVVAQSHTIQHVPPNKLKVLHAHPLTQSQRSQLLAQSRAGGITQLPTMVSLAALGEGKSTPALHLKTTQGQVAQFFEIKGGQLGKGPHLVNVVRQPQPGKTTVARLDLNDAKKRQVVATFDGATLKGNMSGGGAARPHRVSVSVDGRQIVRTAALPAVRAQPLRQQIQLKAARPQDHHGHITIAAPTKTASIPHSVVANLLQKSVQLPRGGQKIGISGAASVQAIAFATPAQLRARGARPAPPDRQELLEGPSGMVGVASSSSATLADTDSPMEAQDSEPSTNGGGGTVRRRPADNLPMEVT